jgi:hypothetical protein
MTNPRDRRLKVYCAPEVPSQETAIHQICEFLGIELTGVDGPDTVARFFWHDATHKSRPDHVDGSFFNGRCLDISKSNVQRVFAETFGYELAIDPRKFRGTAVEKSELNASHSGHLTNLPIESPRQGYVYEKFVDSIEDGLATCLRITVFGQKIAAVYKHYRPADKPFANGSEFVKVELCETNRVLSQREQDLVIKFCQAIGMDYGDLDAPRDIKDGQLYIVDANPTPYRHPEKLGDDFHQQVLDTTAPLFAPVFIKSDVR